MTATYSRKDGSRDPRTASYGITATFASRCGLCGEPVPIGDRLFKLPANRTGPGGSPWVCRSCRWPSSAQDPTLVEVLTKINHRLATKKPVSEPPRRRSAHGGNQCSHRPRAGPRALQRVAARPSRWSGADPMGRCHARIPHGLAHVRVRCQRDQQRDSHVSRRPTASAPAHPLRPEAPGLAGHDATEP